METGKHILLADDEPNLRRVICAQLERDGFDVTVVDHGQAAIDQLKIQRIDVVITDMRMPHVDGMTLLKHINEHYQGIPVIMITAHGTVDTAVEALKLGAFDYITKPFEREELRHVVAKASRTSDLAQRDLGRETVSTARDMLIGNSAAMKEVQQVIERVADTPSTVLVTGESGTGKELIARMLHSTSSRRDKPFIAVHCAAIPSELIESELFGYEKGAFTGAVTSKPGRFELAHGGTLFLDEIGEIPLPIQVKLLRVLQESEFERVGGIRTIKVDVRLVAATNRDLQHEIAEERFREDLYYRLNVVQTRLPPLRERKEDIPLFVEHFMTKFNERLGKQIKSISPQALEVLQDHSWRGNIRELENVMERSVLFCDKDVIEPDDIPQELLEARVSQLPAESLRLANQPPAAKPEELSLKDAVREVTLRVEKDMIVRALEQTEYNVTHAAKLLKISRKSLQTKMKELGLRSQSSGNIP